MTVHELQCLYNGTCVCGVCVFSGYAFLNPVGPAFGGLRVCVCVCVCVLQSTRVDHPHYAWVSRQKLCVPCTWAPTVHTVCREVSLRVFAQAYTMSAHLCTPRCLCVSLMCGREHIPAVLYLRAPLGTHVYTCLSV